MAFKNTFDLTEKHTEAFSDKRNYKKRRREKKKRKKMGEGRALNISYKKLLKEKQK